MAKKKEITIGRRYYASMHMVLCHGPIDELQQIIAGEKSIYADTITSNTRINIKAGNVFGGEKKEGGIEGPVDILFGERDQEKNPHLISQLGNAIPAFRGVFSIVLNQVYLTAMTRYPKPWWFIVQRCAARSWYPETCEIPAGNGIPSGSTNGAHIIYEIITDTDWGMGLPTSIIDDVSFREVADQLMVEQFGLSLLFSRQGPAEELISIILNHIGGVFYSNTNGQFVLRLVRAPTQTELDEAVTFDEGNIVARESFQRASFGDMVNEVIIKYRPQASDKDSALTFQDLASIQLQGAVISQTLDFSGIDNEVTCAKVGQRELRNNSTPLAKVTLVVNRVGFSVTIGNIVRYTDPMRGVSNMILRVFGVNYGSLEQGEVTLDLVEDVFSFPETSYLSAQPPLFIDPLQVPVNSPDQRLREMTFWDSDRDLTETESLAVPEGASFIHMLVDPPDVASPQYELFTDEGAGSDLTFKEESDYAPISFLSVSISYLDANISLSFLTLPILEIVIGTFAYIDDEIVRIDSFDEDNNIVRVGRGCLDTVPVQHAANTKIVFTEDTIPFDPLELMIGDRVRVTALVTNDAGAVPLNTAPISTLTMVGRRDTPYPPGRLRLNSFAYPDSITDDITVLWSHRDRRQQLATIIDTNAGSIGPEPGTSYTVRYLREGTLLREVTGITFINHIYTTDDELADSGTLGPRITIELFSERDTFKSFQTHVFTVDHIFTVLGTGFNLTRTFDNTSTYNLIGLFDG